ncbi:MAG: DUF3846 domain-containing protein [Bacteroidales bacterium]|nr:DUF3846 domain-containing protein [Bacteroidales bacterium]
MNNYAVLVRVDHSASVYEVDLNNELSSLQKAVDGDIEPIPYYSKGIMLGDGEAKCKSKDMNLKATMECFPGHLLLPDYIAGDVLILPHSDGPDFLFFSKEDAEKLAKKMDGPIITKVVPKKTT